MLTKYIEEISNMFTYPENNEIIINVINNYFLDNLTENFKFKTTFPIYKNIGNKDEKKIALISYLDEPGFQVKGFLGNGFISFGEYGAIDLRSLTAQEVIICSEKNYFGIIGNKPSHYLTEDDKNKLIDIEHLFIDTGWTDDEEIQNRIKIGDFIGLHSEFTWLKNHTMSGHGLSNKLGSAVLLSCAEKLKDFECPVYFIMAENNARGRGQIKKIIEALDIDMSIQVNTVKTNRLQIDDPESIYLGKGPAIAFGGSIDYQLSHYIVKYCCNRNIPFQRRFYNFDDLDIGSFIYTAGKGCPSAMISLPVENVGMANEIMKLNDIEIAAEIISGIILSHSKFSESRSKE